MSRVRRALRILLIGGAAAFGVLAAVFGYLRATTDLDRARFAHPEDASTFTDRHGAPLRHHRPDGHDRRWVALDEVSPNLVEAILAVEDDRFHEHSGVDARAIGRALFSFALPGRRLSGGSTISQQVVKLVYGRPEGLWSKPREIVRALILEERFDKPWILEQYLNRLPYGDQVVGVARASELYFGKPVSELSVGEAALLAGIPQAPSALDPRRHLDAALRRRRIVLARMRDTGRIDAETFVSAQAEPVVIAARPMRPWRAPRAVDAALGAVRAGELEATRGRARLSLDLALQGEAERIMRGTVRDLSSRGVTNGAAVLVSNSSGEILAYVGAARGGSEAPGGWLDLAASRRQPGSTLKPFVYELFFERGGTAASLLDDIARPMVGHGGTLFEARNYDGMERGPVRARVALSSSLNLAALDAARRVGAENIVTRFRALGLTHLDDASRYGAAIVLGGGDVSLRDLAGMYTTLARRGSRVPITFGVRGPTDGVREMDEAAATVTLDILRDGRARRDAFGDDLEGLMGGRPFGLKTGTSSGWRDAWTAVLTDELTVVVWVGDPAGRPLAGVSGFAGAARPAVRILAAAHRRLEGLAIPEAEPAPELLVHAQICASTGALAGPACGRRLIETFAPGTAPHEVCDAHRADGSVALPRRYAHWLSENHPAGFGLASASREDGRAPVVVHPRDGARLLVEEASTVPLRARVGDEVADASWEVDGEAIEGGRWAPSSGEHVLVARVGELRSEPVSVVVREAR